MFHGSTSLSLQQKPRKQEALNPLTEGRGGSEERASPMPRSGAGPHPGLGRRRVANQNPPPGVSEREALGHTTHLNT